MNAETYDLVVKGGRVIDPATSTDAILDVAVTNGKIAAVGSDLSGATTLDAKGMIVTPGLIDTHAHIYEHVTGDFGLNADLVGVRGGVTTVVDQGGASALTFGGFRQSGLGREGGREAIEAYTEVKTVLLPFTGEMM